MLGGDYEDYVDLYLPGRFRKLLGKCGIFEGIPGPRCMPVRDYGLPEHQALLVALWSFTQLPFCEQQHLIRDHLQRKKSG